MIFHDLPRQLSGVVTSWNLILAVIYHSKAYSLAWCHWFGVVVRYTKLEFLQSGLPVRSTIQLPAQLQTLTLGLCPLQQLLQRERRPLIRKLFCLHSQSAQLPECFPLEDRSHGCLRDLTVFFLLHDVLQLTDQIADCADNFVLAG